MIIFLLIIGLIISLGLNVTAFIIFQRLLKKIDIYESWILKFKNDLSETLDSMRKIDKQGTFATSINDKGVFESDDQVGEVFKKLLELIINLNDKTQ